LYEHAEKIVPYSTFSNIMSVEKHFARVTQEIERHLQPKRVLTETIARTEREIADFQRHLSLCKKMRPKEATREEIKRSLCELAIEVSEKRSHIEELSTEARFDPDRKPPKNSMFIAHSREIGSSTENGSIGARRPTIPRQTFASRNSMLGR
jgi:predicted DNA-binding protein YlxM (UPF0122 family)